VRERGQGRREGSPGVPGDWEDCAPGPEVLEAGIGRLGRRRRARREREPPARRERGAPREFRSGRTPRGGGDVCHPAPWRGGWGWVPLGKDSLNWKLDFGGVFGAHSCFSSNGVSLPGSSYGLGPGSVWGVRNVG
jgi:hypothetical protein